MMQKNNLDKEVSQTPAAETVSRNESTTFADTNDDRELR
jgi:hypothetical protein